MDGDDVYGPDVPEVGVRHGDLFFPGLFLFGFFAGMESSSHKESVRRLAIMLLRFVAAYNLLDATLMVFVGAVKGAGDTPFVLRVSLVMAVALAGLSWLGVEVWQFGIYGCWALITGWVWALGLIYLFRFLQGKWRNMRVIEPIPPDARSTTGEAAVI